MMEGWILPPPWKLKFKPTDLPSFMHRSICTNGILSAQMDCQNERGKVTRNQLYIFYDFNSYKKTRLTVLLNLPL